MIARRASTVCLSCRCHGTVTTRRRIQHSVKRRSQAVAIRHDESHEGVAHESDAAGQYEEGGVRSARSVADTIKRWRTQVPLDNIREAVQTLEALVKQRDKRIEVLRSIKNPWPVPVQQNHHSSAKTKLQLPEAQAAPISHETFRELMKQASGAKQIRAVLRAQLLRVQHPKDLLRVAAVAMQSRTQAEQLAVVHEPVMRALYRCRNTATDTEVLRTCSTIVARLSFAGLVPHYQLLTIGLKFAARARSVNGMKKFLKLVHEQSNTMTSNLFRSVIAKCSIGHRGLGEIRNGRWRRADLFQVLTGFGDCKHLPPEKQFHLGAFLDRNDWQYLHGWVAILARCRASDAVWEEWLLWKDNPARTSPKRLESTERYMNTQWRGDYWFVEQMTYTDDIRRAWRILENTQIPFTSLKDRIKLRLLDGVEHASIWTLQMTDSMLAKYDAELLQIERAFGVVWQPGTGDGDGQHVQIHDLEEALDELGAQDWQSEIDYGFPTAQEGDSQGDNVVSTREPWQQDANLLPRETRADRTAKLHDTHDVRVYSKYSIASA